MSLCEYKDRGCGGCPLLNTPYPQQLAQKQGRMEKLLGRWGKVQPIVGMEEPFHYRNKAIATFTLQKGRLAAGIYQEGTHRVVPARGCLLQSEVLNQTVEAVVKAANACRYTPYNEDKGTGLLRHVQARHAFATGQVLVTVVTGQPELPGAKNFVKELRRLAPWVTSVVQNYNPRATSAVLGKQEKVLYGSGMVRDELCGKSFLLSSRSFYQVNPAQTEKLYSLALEAAGLTGTEKVIDAYCGAGTIGLAAAPHAGQVLGVELNPDAARDAVGNAKFNKAANARFYCGDATQWLAQMAARGEKADVVFLDPPRQGSTPEFLNSVLALAPRRVVYVSCGPDTQDRDLEILVKGGYRVQSIQPVDMFPHTDHVETVVALGRE
ncbi:MAG: 23S rRNA (uracil(1939)-C(5))-methyltransferase RlmD [Oscillospiraceae bacterium]|nr:23S rRNA (uracil(1939)-C(5))-methyltransferase RlmD [Oscillospiraceae bacterium]